MHDYAWLVVQGFLFFAARASRGASFPLWDGAEVCVLVQLYRCARRADYLGRAGKISRESAEKAGELTADLGGTRMGGNRR